MVRLFSVSLVASLLSVVYANYHEVLVPDLLEGHIQVDALKAHARQLQSFADAHSSTRVFGSPGYNASVEYIYNTLKDTNAFHIELQTFPYEFSEVRQQKLEVASAPIQVQAFTYSPSTSATGLTAPLVYIPDQEAAPSGGCTAADFAGVDVVGKIAVIQRGACTFAIKTTNAKNAGAVGAIIYNNADGIVAGTLGAPGTEYVPVGGITKVAGEALVARLTAGEALSATLTLEILVEQRYSSNIIATTIPGTRENIIFVGSHLDSVSAGPGLNDNGSGSITLLEIALQITRFQITNAVRFAWWTAEEFGLVGSEYHVDHLTDADLSKVALYLNFDMVASPNYVIAAYDGDDSSGLNPNGPGPAGSNTIEKRFNDYFALRGVPVIPTAFSGRSDYGPFIARGVPAGGLFTGAEGLKTPEQAVLFGGQAGIALDANYHAPGDTYDNLNFDAFLINAKAAANVIAQFVLSVHDVKDEQKAAASESNTNRINAFGDDFRPEIIGGLYDALAINGPHPAHEDHGHDAILA